MYLLNELTLLVRSSFMYLLSFVLDNWLTKAVNSIHHVSCIPAYWVLRNFLPFQWHCFFMSHKTSLYNGVLFDTCISKSLKCNHTAISTEYWKCLTFLDKGLIGKILLAKIWVWTLQDLRDKANLWELWMKVLPSHLMVIGEAGTVNSVNNISVAWKIFNVVLYHEIRSGAF
jgi:hypothetical protein